MAGARRFPELENMLTNFQAQTFFLESFRGRVVRVVSDDVDSSDASCTELASARAVPRAARASRLVAPLSTVLRVQARRAGPAALEASHLGFLKIEK